MVITTPLIGMAIRRSQLFRFVACLAWGFMVWYFYVNHFPDHHEQNANGGPRPFIREGKIRSREIRCLAPLQLVPPDTDKVSLCKQLNIQCEKQHDSSTTTSDGTVPSVKSGSRRFARAVRKYCPETPGKRVPNLVHYVWFGIKNMTFYQMVSFFSVHKFQKPCLILLHGDIIPTGPYWKYLVRHVSNIIHVATDEPTKTKKNNEIHTIEHRADLLRLMVINEYGGIYLDLDSVLLRSLDPLMNHPVTMSLEYPTNLSIGLIVAERYSLFIRHWLNLFHEQYCYDPKKYFEFSMFMPTRIAKEHPSWIHVENMTFCTPNGIERKTIFEGNYDWKENYAMHLYIRYYTKSDDVNSVRKLNTTIGSLARHVLYGTRALCED